MTNSGNNSINEVIIIFHSFFFLLFNISFIKVSKIIND